MHHDQIDEQLDEPLPPLDRPGVPPFWRLVAILSLLGVAGLLCMVIVLLVALAQPGNRADYNGGLFAGAAMAVGPPVVAEVAEGEEPDPLNPPYPLKQDLRPPGTVPVPGAAEPAERGAPVPRREFLKHGQSRWTNPAPEAAPDRVLVSPDGAHMAYANGDVLMAGAIGLAEAVGEDMPFRGRGPGAKQPRPGGPGMPAGAMGGPGGGAMAGPGGPARSSGDHPRATLSGWAVDGSGLYWSNAGGRVCRYDPQANATTPTTTHAAAALPAPGKDQLVLVRTQLRPKANAPGGRAAHDLTEVVLFPALDAVQNPTLVQAGPARWHSPALSPDGKRLAIVCDENEGPARCHVFVFALEGHELRPVPPVSPGAARIEGVCWRPDGQALVYARSQSPAPADHAADMPKDACDLYLLDLATKKETRLSRGGGFTSPSLTKDGQLFFLARTPQEGAPPTVELVQMALKAVQDFAEDEEKLARKGAKAWTELADVVLKEAGVGKVDGDWLADGRRLLDAGSMKKIAEAFAAHYGEKLKADPPATAAALERQRRELAALDLPAAEQDRLVLLLGAVEGEYLRGRQQGSAWHLASKPNGTVHGENPFGVAFNPFRPLRPREMADKDDSPQSLAELLYRAEGRPLVLNHEPVAAKKALDELVDGDLARGTALLKEGKGDEGQRVLLDMVKRHAGNQYLAVQVGALLHEHGRTKALADLLKPLLDQLDAPGGALPRDARLYNLLGVALLDGDVNRAITAFREALRCDLNYGPAYLNLAQAYQKANRAQDARLCLRRYLKLFPDGELADDARRRLNAAGDDNGPAIPGGQ